jgi:hypothetical protein
MAQIAPRVKRAPDLDIRTAQTPEAVAYRARVGLKPDVAASLAAARKKGVERLRKAFNDLEVISHLGLGTPEAVGVRYGAGILTMSVSDRSKAVREFLSKYADAYGVSEADLKELKLKSDRVDSGGMGWAEFEQQINDKTVFQANIRGAFNAKGQLTRVIGIIASVHPSLPPATTPQIDAARAVSLAAASVGVNETPRPSQRTSLLHFPVAPGVVRLAWYTQVGGYMFVLDAADGTLVWRGDAVDY